MELTRFLTFEQAVFSQTAIRKGIANIPTSQQIESIRLTSAKIWIPIKTAFPNAQISSFFRNEELNKLIGGSTTSQHCKGEAIDITLPTPKEKLELFEWVKKNLQFDQLILEFPDKEGNPSWVHVSHSSIKNRREVLKAVKVGGATKYIKY